MPLSDHEQRMLDQIESALYAEDPKFASSVRGGTLRAPSARRRLQGAALFLAGLAMLVAGIAIPATRIGDFAILSVVGFIAMFGGVVFAITGPKVIGKREAPNDIAAARQKRAKGGSGSFTSRMEDRFRRRFDE
ncbi:membrane protein [Mycolicibacterium cyprinidarum]|uniref:Membrane protein n=1 Tax=Mycolicibacterium cyprinidarum TaxID=2860311 RepID=A0ABQ4VCM9_9MYCO|nr:membrane protein [Mycolicibacterium sp. NGTWS0302]GJF16930.1 membrane protein [Mycolicibacterium sp. NGTWS1803]GJF19812.1 membrane protein [Mycolicibacterium sp. NGTWSNA01]